MSRSGLLKSTSPVTGDCFHLLSNRHNFEKSGRPARFMFYSNKEWNDFGGNAPDAMRQGFAARHPAVEIDIEGTHYLIDFLRMMQIDLTKGTQRSIAWIDESGKCFFPIAIIGIDETDAQAGPPRRRPGRPPKVPKKDSYGPTRAHAQNASSVNEAGPSRPPPYPQPVFVNRNSTSSAPTAVERPATGWVRLNNSNPY